MPMSRRIRRFSPTLYGRIKIMLFRRSRSGSVEVINMERALAGNVWWPTGRACSRSAWCDNSQLDRRVPSHLLRTWRHASRRHGNGNWWRRNADGRRAGRHVTSISLSAVCIPAGCGRKQVKQLGMPGLSRNGQKNPDDSPSYNM